MKRVATPLLLQDVARKIVTRCTGVQITESTLSNFPMLENVDPSFACLCNLVIVLFESRTRIRFGPGGARHGEENRIESDGCLALSLHK